jgi:hypothetical protein
MSALETQFAERQVTSWRNFTLERQTLPSKSQQSKIPHYKSQL